MTSRKKISDKGENIVIFGFGAQGKAQALNLKDLSFDVSIFLRAKSEKLGDAQKLGFTVITSPEAAARVANVAVLLIPDTEQAAFYRKYLHEGLPKNAMLVFAHGFSLHYGLIKPRKDLDSVLAAPLGHADAVRGEFTAGGGVPFIVAVMQDATGKALQRAKSYAQQISRKGPFIHSTVAEEVETDMFVEQALLCGGLPELVRKTFETLVHAGYDPDIAYFSCVRELSPIVSLIGRHGISGMRDKISDTARYGALTRGTRAIGQGTGDELKKMMDEIRSGKFASEFLSETKSGKKTTAALMNADRSHPIEGIHRRHMK